MRFRRKFEPQSAINLVPMVDVVFQLVLFFLVSTTLALVPGIRLELPASGTAENVPVRQLVVTVVSPTELWFNNEPVASPAELDRRIASMERGRPAGAGVGDHRGGPAGPVRTHGRGARRAAQQRPQGRRAEDPEP